MLGDCFRQWIIASKNPSLYLQVPLVRLLGSPLPIEQ